MGRIDELKKRKETLNRLIIFARQKREEVISLVKNLASQFNSGKITRIEYHDKLYDSLRLKTPKEWIKYYDEYIASCEEKIRACDKLIDEEKSFSGREKRIGLLKFFIVLVFIGIIVSLIFNFSPGIYDSIGSISERILQGGLNSIAKLIPVKEKLNEGVSIVLKEKPGLLETNIPPEIMGEKKPAVIFLNKEASFSEENVQYQAVVGEKVKWKKKIIVSSDEEFKLNLPLGSENINVSRIIYGKESNIISQVKINRGGRFLGIFGNEGVSVNKLKGRGEYGVIYETPAPEIKEEQIGKKLRVTIKGPDDIHYTDVLSFSDIPEKLKIGEEYKIRLNQIFDINGSSYEEAVEFSAYDTNENGFIDKIEWITPQLSESIFEIIIIEITKASHLDSNRDFLNDIYDSVKAKDGNWSERIYDNEYVRVMFEKTLTSSNDVTFYGRNIENSRTIVEVYLENGDEKIAEFPIIDQTGKYQIYLTDLGDRSSDIFDLKIKNLDGNSNAYLEFDYIVDPIFQVGLDVLYPVDLTKTMNVTQNNFFNVTLNVTCLKGNCGIIEVRLDPIEEIANESIESLQGLGGSGFPTSFSNALDSNGKMHMVHGARVDYLRYCNNLAGSWSCVQIQGSYSNGDPSIAIDSNNKAHVSYTRKDISNGRFYLKYCNNLGGSFSCVDVDKPLNQDTGFYSSIAIDKNNKVHISYRYNTFDGDLRYCNNIAGGWSCTTTIDSSGDVGFAPSIAIDSNNKAHISYTDATNKKLKYCNNIAGGFSCTVLDNTVNVEQFYSSIAIDSNNKAYISYKESTNKDLKYCNNAGGGWACAIVDSTGDAGSYSSIAIDKNDKVHIFYFGDGKLKEASNIQGIWKIKLLYLGGTSVFGGVYQRNIAVKKGRIVDSSLSDKKIHVSFSNLSDAVHLTYQFEEDEKGLISNIIGATPFYTIVSNPFSTSSLNEGENETVVFWVNATGKIGSIWKFFAYANMSSDMSIGNMSDKWEVRIKSEFEVDSCRILDKPNSVYNQTADIINSDMAGIDSCINITAENITFNGNGHQIIGSSDSTKGGIYSNSSNTTIMNAKIERFGYGIKINSNYSFIFNNSLNHQLNGFGIYLESSSNNRIINNNADYNDAISEGIGIYLSNSHNNSLLNNSASFNFVTGISLYQSSNNTLINNSANSNGNGLGDGTGIKIISSLNNTLININANSNYLYGVYLFDSSNNVLINNSANGNGFYGFYLKSSSGNTFNLSRGYDNYYNLFLVDSSNANEFIDASAAGSSAYSFEFYNSNNNVLKDSYLLFTNTILSHQNSINNTLLNCTYNLAQESVDSNSELIRKWHYRAYVQDESLVPVDKVNVSAYNVSDNYNFNLTSDSSGYTGIGEIIDYVNKNGIRNYYSNYTIYADNKSDFDLHTYNASLGNNLMDVFTLIPIKPPEIVYISDLGYIHPEVDLIDPSLRDLLADDSARKDFEFYAYSKNIQQLPILVNNDNALLTVINKNSPSIERKSSDGGKAIVCFYDRDENAPNEALPGYAGKLCRVYRCSVAMQYYDDYGGSQNPNWEVKAYIKDGLGFEEGYKNGIDIDNSIVLPVRETYFNILQDSKLVPEAEGLNFGEVGYGPQVREPIGTYPLRIRNTGNADITSVKVTGKNIPGVTNPAEFIQASWFKVSQVGQSCGDGISLENNVPVDSGLIVIAHAPNSYSEMRVCLTNVEGVSRQSYSASGSNAWLIDTSFQGFLVAVAIGIKRRRKKKNKVLIENVLNDFEKKLEKYGISFDELLRVREEKLRKTGIFDRVLTGKEKEIKIPLELFSQEIGCAEALCKYLKEEKGLRLNEIAKLLNRDQRTIGINYRNSLKKKISIEVKDYEKAVPVEIFSDRRMSILESVVNYLREKGMKNSEIALMLGKDQRNIGTLYSRVKRKIKN